MEIQKIKYKHYKEYIDGWFEQFDHTQRRRMIGGNLVGNKRILAMNDYQYNQQMEKWRHKASSNHIQKYLDINSQIKECIDKYMPRSFTIVNYSSYIISM